MNILTREKEQFLRGIEHTLRYNGQLGFLFLAFVAALFVLVLVLHAGNAYAFLQFDALPFSTRMSLIASLFLSTFIEDSKGILMITFTALLIALNVTLLRTYTEDLKQGLGIMGVGSGFGTLIATLALGCAACGGAILFFLSSSLVSVAIPVFFSWGDALVAFGIGSLVLSNLWMLRKLGDPIVCEPTRQ